MDQEFSFDFALKSAPFIEAKKLVAQAQELIAARPEAERVLRMDLLVAAQQRLSTHFPGRQKARLEKLLKRTQRRRFGLFFGSLRRRTLTKRFWARELRKQAALDKRIATDFHAEVLVEQAVSKVSGIVGAAHREIQREIDSTGGTSLDQWGHFFVSARGFDRLFGNQLWHETGLDSFAATIDLVNPSQVVYGHDTSTNKTKIVIEPEPDTATLLEGITPVLWQKRLDMIAHFAGEAAANATERSVRQGMYDSIAKDGRATGNYLDQNSYTKILSVLGPRMAVAYALPLIKPADYVFNNYQENILAQMRALHTSSPELANVIEEQLTTMIINERAVAYDTINKRRIGQSLLWPEGEACLDLLQEFAPEKARAINGYNPLIKVFDLAQQISCAPLATLRAMPEQDKIRALQLLGHFKFISLNTVTPHMAAAITALSVATPLSDKRRSELDTIANQFFDRLDKTSLSALNDVWDTLPVAAKQQHIEMWHDTINDILGLPNKTLKVIDTETLAERPGTSQKNMVGLHSHKEGIEIATGKRTMSDVMDVIVHESLHELHAFKELELIPLSDSIDDAFLRAQKQLDSFAFTSPKEAAATDPAHEQRAKVLNGAIYRSRAEERESYYLGGKVADKVKVLLAHKTDPGLATYLTVGSEQMTMPTQKLITMLGITDAQPSDEGARLVGLATEISMSTRERPVFDLRLAGDVISISPLENYLLNETLLGDRQLVALRDIGQETVTVRMPTRDAEEIKRRINVTTAYPLPVAASLAVPSMEEVFSLPHRGRGGAASATTPLLALTYN